MAGRSASNTITRYAGIQVQTSALGLNVPVGWGTFRCKCNLVDYLDFKSKAQKAGASKGGSTTTGYSYSATVILALCEGPIDSISTIYVNGKVYKNGARTALAQANLNLHTGAVGQPVWGYLTSNHAAHAIGYSGLAIAYQSNYALDSSAQTPNHSFEVVRTAGYGVAGTPDADPSLVVADFFENSRYGVPSWGAGLLGDLTQFQDYCLAAGLLVSPVIDSQRSASEFLTELLKGTNSTCVWSEGVLKFIPYGDTALSGNGKIYTPNNTAVYSLGDDDYIPQAAGDDPLTIDIQDQSDAYNVIQLEYLDRTNQYNMAIALASDAANVAQYGMRRKDPDTVHCIATPAVAALSAQLYLQRTLYVRSRFKFTLGWQFALLEPGDVLELTDSALGLSAYPVRITQIEDDEDACRAIIAEDFPVGVHHAPLYTMQTGLAVSRDTNIDPGSVEANLLLWSGDASNGAWGKNQLTVAGAAANDQYGLATAASLTPAAVNAEHFVNQVVANCFAGKTYTYSVCLQKGAHNLVIVQVLTAGGADYANLNVDINAGVVVSTFATAGCTIEGAEVVPTLVAGIWQCNLTLQFASISGGTLTCAVIPCDPAFNGTWTGDGQVHSYLSQQALRPGVDPGVYAQTTTEHAQPVLFNPPAALNDGGSSMFAAVAGGPNWGGCNVWVSVDGANFDEIGQITGPARYGLLTAAFPSHADPDTADTLGVDLGWSGGALAGASQASVDQGATTSWIEGELVGFEAATLTAPSRYNLGTYIRRGFQNTPIAAHNPGDAFVRMDSALFDFPYLDINSGETIYLKFQSFNIYGQALEDLSTCVTYSAVPNPVAADAPGASAWTATAATLSAAGVVVPVLEITGAVDNPGAGQVQFFYRPHGSGPWISDGAFPAATTIDYISSVLPGGAYDVGVAYVVNGVDTPLTQIGANIILANAVAPAIVGQANAATDPTIQPGATRNITTYSPAAPASPADGDFWVDTAVNPNIAYLRAGGAWQVAASYTYNTNQLTDGAGLGTTALWTGVSGAGRPADNATKNTTTYSASLPSGGSNGDIWVYTGATPNLAYLNAGGTWQVAANTVTGTSQITDDAVLGQTAHWTGVSSKPANLAALNGAEGINNALVSIGSNGALSGAGGGAVTLPGLGAGALATLNATNTPQITPGAVTSPSVWSATAAQYGSGAGVYFDVFNETLTVGYSATVLVWAQARLNDGGGHAANSHSGGLQVIINGATVQTTEIDTSPNAICAYTCICSQGVAAGTVNIDIQAMCASFDYFTYRSLIVEVVYR